MRIGVMGAGAVGCYYSGMLARGGHEVVLVGRPVHVEAMREHGLRMETAAFDERIAVEAATEPEVIAGCDVVLVAVKSADTDKGSSIRPVARLYRSQIAGDKADSVALHDLEVGKSVAQGLRSVSVHSATASARIRSRRSGRNTVSGTRSTGHPTTRLTSRSSAPSCIRLRGRAIVNSRSTSEPSWSCPVATDPKTRTSRPPAAATSPLTSPACWRNLRPNGDVPWKRSRRDTSGWLRPISAAICVCVIPAAEACRTARTNSPRPCAFSWSARRAASARVVDMSQV